MVKRKQKLNYSVSVIIPCYNEEENIEECIKRTPKLGKSTEIVVVDDGSSDATATIAKKVAKKKKNVKVISYSPNEGKGNAVRKGLDKATGDILLVLDADMTVRPEDLPKMLKPIMSGKADFVNGTRLTQKMQDGAMKGLNNFGNHAMAVLFSLVFRKRITDTLCGTKIFFKKDYKKFGIHPEDPWGDFSMLFGAAKLKLRLIEVPIKYYARVAGESKMKFLSHSISLMKVWWKLYRNYTGTL